MAQEVTIMTPEHVELRFELAGIGSRFIAVLLDTLLQALALTAILLAMGLGLGGLSMFDRLTNASAWVMAILTLVLFVILSGYFLYFEATRNGQTPGKKSVGIRVIRDTGHPIDFRGALLRNVMRTVDSLPGAYGVGIVSVFFSPQYRRLGDYVAGTLVVRVAPPMVQRPEPAAAAAAPTFQSATPVENAYTIPTEAMPYISSITKDDYRAVRHFLDRKRELEPGVATELAKRLAAPIAQKINLEQSQISDPAAFLEAVGVEWEKRVIH
jgi:uncharacterized RDD family membrane protein YckC